MKRAGRSTHLVALLLFAFSCTSVIAGAESKITPSAKDKCPVCGMFVAKYPEWTACSKWKDGATYFFDGPKDMFTHYLNIGSNTSPRKQGDLAGLFVKEYYSLKVIDARSAFFVIGSDVYGPMGGELVPFATQKDAASFMNDHNGKKIVRFNEVNLPLLKLLK